MKIVDCEGNNYQTKPKNYNNNKLTKPNQTKPNQTKKNKEREQELST